MKKTIIILFIVAFVSSGCNNEQNKSDYLLDDYKALVRNEDSLKLLVSNLIEENTKLKESIDSLGKVRIKDNLNSQILESTENFGKYSYIKKFKKNYPSLVDLYTKGPLNASLLKLLGKENYNIFIENMSVQIPIDIINDEYTLLTGIAPQSGGYNTAAILIDFRTHEISVGMLVDGEDVLYFTEKPKKGLQFATNEIQNWLLEAHESIGVKMWERF